jgi:hypothetical protein
MSIARPPPRWASAMGCLNVFAQFRPLSGRYAILRILEQHYIKEKKPRGNQTVEQVQFGPGGSMVVTENGAQAAAYPPNSRI